VGVEHLTDQTVRLVDLVEALDIMVLVVDLGINIHQHLHYFQHQHQDKEIMEEDLLVLVLHIMDLVAVVAPGVLARRELQLQMDMVV
jgi:hypothetical protein